MITEKRRLSRDPLGDPSMGLLPQTSETPQNAKTRLLLSSGLPVEILQVPNLYAYVGNSPVNRIDPDGRFFGEGAVLGGIMGGAAGLLGGAIDIAIDDTLRDLRGQPALTPCEKNDRLNEATNGSKK